ncbi:hypothetical protein [Sphingorhabdus sp. Alg239-R122]|uniref:hypothetical protein n=1 Tax=Sphingorhabdus sp. Alg239-R122 TaxID=2305989 RepID=UPI0013DBF993|nr:hypothetical protein [Sphingorhabdus sp. Alg239-R122]
MKNAEAYNLPNPGHDFRRALPKAVLHVESEEQQEQAGWASDDSRLFFMSFVAFFLAITAFIS